MLGSASPNSCFSHDRSSSSEPNYNTLLSQITSLVKVLGEILVNQYCGRLLSIEILVGKAESLATLSGFLLIVAGLDSGVLL